jgi:hypothetical protein
MSDDLERRLSKNPVIQELHRRRIELFDAICAELAGKYGHARNPDKLTANLREKIAQEAEALTETWAEDEHENWDKQVHSKLQDLLKEHHEVGERLLTERDIALFGDDPEYGDHET